MFTIDDLWKLISYLKDGTTNSSLSELTTTLSTSEKITTTTLFEQVLDQNTFTSNDYKKLRSFMIDWYSGHKAIATTQRFASDVHQLPNAHLSELFKSFGFLLGLDLVPLTSKANFFLDLVNFYKKKGTPETLVDVLDYYGFSDSDLVEYWLQKDSYGNLIFRGDSVRQASTGSTLLVDTDVSFEKMTGEDPHWFQTKEHIESLILTNTINLPSKTPYFSLNSIFSLFSINISLSLMFRVVKDQYDRYLLNKPLPYNIPVKNLGMVIPILHIYIASIYTFEKMFGKNTSTEYLNCGCYNGELTYKGDPPIVSGLPDIVTKYEELIARPTSRLDMDTRLLQLKNEWSILNSNNFLNFSEISETLLTELDPSLKNLIDTWFNIGDQNYLITYLLGTLDNWIKLNINTKSPSLVIIMLGIGFREELDAIVNFFKPYRARLAFMDTAFSIKNPLTESVMLDEWLLTQIESSYHNSIRPLSYPLDNCLNKLTDHSITGTPPIGYGGSLYKWDIGSFFDIPPFDQMDDTYYDKLKLILEASHTGTICDDVIVSIESFFKEKLGARISLKDYDLGGNYDTYPVIFWQDECELKIESKVIDKIEITELPIISMGMNIHDNFGMEPPTQYDVGSYYDTLQNKSIVRDDFHIDVSSLGIADIKTNVSGNLSFGSIELLSSSQAITSMVLCDLTTGSIEDLSFTIIPINVSGFTGSSWQENFVFYKKANENKLITTNVILTKELLTWNLNYDTGHYYDSNPSFAATIIIPLKGESIITNLVIGNITISLTEVVENLSSRVIITDLILSAITIDEAFRGNVIITDLILGVITVDEAKFLTGIIPIIDHFTVKTFDGKPVEIWYLDL